MHRCTMYTYTYAHDICRIVGGTAYKNVLQRQGIGTHTTHHTQPRATVLFHFIFRQYEIILCASAHVRTCSIVHRTMYYVRGT